MANSEVASFGVIAAAKANEITVGTTAPVSPVTGNIWIDTTTTPGTIKIYASAAWQAVITNPAFASFLGQDFGG